MGYKSTAQNPEVKKKAEATNRANHGGLWNNQLESDKKKRAETNRRNHGGILHYHTSEFLESLKKIERKSYKYRYNDLLFDSKEELAFYIYHTEVLKEEVEREPIVITYKVNEKIHNYYPDFRINKQLYEIKGSWGINGKGEWCLSPWKHKKICNKYKNEDSFNLMCKIIEADKPYKAKYKAALENNVIIYTDDSPEILEAINYCKTKFSSREWYKQFKIKKKES